MTPRALSCCLLVCLALAAAPAAAQEPASFKVPVEGVTFDLSLPRGWREQTGKITTGALLLEDSRRGAAVTLSVKPAQTGSLEISKNAQRELKLTHLGELPQAEEGFEERVGARLLHLRAALVPFARYDHSQPTHARHVYAWMDGLRLWTITLEVPLKEEAAVLRDLDPILDALVSQAAPVAPHRYALAVQGDSDDKEREAFYRFLVANMDRVAQCKANLRGLRLRVETGTDGKVTRAAALDAQGKEDSSREGAACVVEKVSAIRFPERKKEGLRFVIDLSNVPLPK